jgi:hypothetical protein
MVDKLNLVLTVDEVNVILEGLGSMPFIKVNNVINSIRNQSIAQLNADAEVEKAASAANEKNFPDGLGTAALSD